MTVKVVFRRLKAAMPDLAKRKKGRLYDALKSSRN